MNDEFYKNVISKLPVGYVYHKIICDEMGNPCDYEFIDANQVGKELISAWDPDIIGKKFRDVVSQVNSEMTDWINTCGDVALNGSEVYIDKYIFNTGKMLKVKIWSPEKYYFIVYFMDITDEIKKISETESILHNLFDIIFELDGSYVFTNIVVKDEKVLFLPKNQIIGRSINEIFDDKMTEIIVSAIIKGRQTGRDEIITYPAIGDDDQRWFQALIKCVGEGVDSRVIIGVNDITDQKINDNTNDSNHNNSLPADIKFELDCNYVFKNVEANNDELLFVPRNQIINHSINEIFDDQMTQYFVGAMNKSSLTKKEEILTYPSPNPNENKMFAAKIKCVGEGINKKYLINITEFKNDSKIEELHI